MSDIETLLTGLLGQDFNEIMACFVGDAARGTSTATKPANGKKRRSPQERAFKAAKAAVREGDLIALSRLVKKPSQANWYAHDCAWCLLDEAVKAGSVAMVQWLLEKGANPNTLFYRDKPYDRSQGVAPGFYFSPFASAIRNGDQQIVQLMLAHGADIDLPFVCEADGDYSTCRHIAEQHGMWPCIEAYLLGQAANAATAVGDAKRI